MKYRKKATRLKSGYTMKKLWQIIAMQHLPEQTNNNFQNFVGIESKNIHFI